MVAQRFLAPFVGVRVPTGQPLASVLRRLFLCLQKMGYQMEANPKVSEFGSIPKVGSTPKSVDFNERRRIGQGPSIDNFGSIPKVVE